MLHPDVRVPVYNKTERARKILNSKIMTEQYFIRIQHKNMLKIATTLLKNWKKKNQKNIPEWKFGPKIKYLWIEENLKSG